MGGTLSAPYETGEVILHENVPNAGDVSTKKEMSKGTTSVAVVEVDKKDVNDNVENAVEAPAKKRKREGKDSFAAEEMDKHVQDNATEGPAQMQDLSTGAPSTQAASTKLTNTEQTKGELKLVAEQELTAKLDVKDKPADLNESLALQWKPLTEKACLVDQISVVRAVNNNLTIRSENMSQKKIRLEAELRVKASANVTLASENAGLSNKNASLTRENVNLASENASLTRKIVNLASENSSLTDENQTLMQTNREQELEIESLQETTSNLNYQLSHAKSFQWSGARPFRGRGHRGHEGRDGGPIRNRGRYASQRFAARVPSPRQIFIRGLPRHVTEEDISQFFGTIGSIKIGEETGQPEIVIRTDRHTGEGNGQALVTYDDKDTAETAVVGLNGKWFDDEHEIIVCQAMVRNSPSFYRGRKSGSVYSRHGDWICGEYFCRFENFAWRDTCLKCQAPSWSCERKPVIKRERY